MFDLVPFRRNNSVTKRGDLFDSFLDSFFNDDFPTASGFSSLGSTFKVDLKEDEKSYIIEADLPGIAKEDISLSYSNNYLTIAAKRNETTEDKSENYVRRERRYGEFKRAFYMDNGDENNIDASFKDGVLKITVPKLNNPDSNIKKIDIH
jgi:HSP20 family protein